MDTKLDKRHTAARHAIAWLRHDEQHGGGSSDAGSGTPLHDTQSPDSDTTSSVAAVVAAPVQAAAHRCMTHHHPTAT